MQVNPFNYRGFPERDDFQSRELVHPGTSSPRETIDKSADVSDLHVADPKDFANAIKHAIKNSLLHKLFSAIDRTDQGLFDGYNDNMSKVGASDSSDNSVDGSSVTYSYTSSFSESFELHFSNNENSFSLDLNYSSSESQTISFKQNSDESSFSLEITSKRSFSFELSLEVTAVEQSDPLIIDLDFSGFKFESIISDIQFDLDGDGELEFISNLSGEDAFLAIDKNNNGVIDNGTELFGDQEGAKDGFAALKLLDSNSDHQINAEDQLFHQILLLKFNEYGMQNTRTLSEQGITTLSLNPTNNHQEYENDNLLVSQSTFKTDKGQIGIMGDFLLGMRR
ncbi:MAG: hypothetical protein KUG78_13935 [Kangiellaceae bacterium]|nr:hypothetical protein [Kangiellaceae bacterium]